MKSFEETLADLVRAPGVSGFEDGVREIITRELKPFADELRVDKLGNVVARKGDKNSALKVMLAAHMDEIGFIVRFIENGGCLRFAPMGTWSQQVLPAQRVMVHTRSNGSIPGVIGAKAPHLMTEEEKKKSLDFSQLFIDLGANSKDAVRSLGVEIGDPVTIDRELKIMSDGKTATGKALDDRVGCAVMMEVFKEIGKELDVATYAVATTQEEIGLRGATVSAFDLSPELAIILDVTCAVDVPGVEESEYESRLGAGPSIALSEASPTYAYVAHPKVRKLLIDTAIEEKIPYQLDVSQSGLSDAAAISLARGGVPIGMVYVPCRYLHSPVELVNLIDAKNTSKLVKTFLRRARPGSF
jgi:putative aminopeptidase FrvX